MVLRYLLDEHLRGPLRRAVQWHNGRGSYPLDVVCVGDFPDLQLRQSTARRPPMDGLKKKKLGLRMEYGKRHGTVVTLAW